MNGGGRENSFGKKGIEVERNGKATGRESYRKGRRQGGKGNQERKRREIGG